MRPGLEKLPIKELHDRAIRTATQRLDFGFLWHLISELPAAEVAAGRLDRAQADVVSVARLLNDFVHSDRGDLAEALRPIYVDYLKEHG
jgi:hypothetical protein